MKCPKCGYNSFDYLETCKKCGGDLTEHKTRFGLRSLFFPPQEPQGTAETPPSAVSTVAPLFAEELPFDFDGPGAPLEESAEEESEPFPEAPAEKDVAAPESLDATFEEWPLFREDEEEAVMEEASAAADEAPEPVSEPSEGLAEPEPGAFEATFEDWPLFGDDEGETAAEPAPEPVAEQTEPQPAAADDLFGDWSFPGDDEEAPATAPEAIEPSAPGDAPLVAAPAVRADEAPEPSEDPAGEWALSPDDQEAGAEIDELPADPEDLSEEDAAPVTSGGADFPPEEPALWEGVASEESRFLRSALGNPPPIFPRLGAAAVDLVLLAVTFALFLWVGNEAFRAGGAENAPLIEVALTLAIPYFLVLLGLCFGYFMFFHFLTGQTPGKMLFGLRVEGEDGETLLLSQAFLRSVGGLLALLCLGVGFVPVLGKGQRRGWNDLLAGTRLVSAREEAAVGD